MKKTYYYDNVNDDLIISLCVKDNKKLKSNVTSDAWLNNKPQIKEYLTNRYIDSDSIQETIYRIYNHIENRPTCKYCGGHIRFYKFSEGYAKYCSKTCLNKSSEHIQKVKNTTIKHYGGVANGSPIIRKKSEETCNKHYGCKYILGSKKHRLLWQQSNLEKYGETKPYTYGSETFKQLMIKKYGVENVFQSNYFKNIIKEKYIEYNTTKTYYKFNSSKIEKDFIKYLEQNYPDDFIYQYKSKLYPFNCDFYIKSLDLYIEIQGTWQHGKHPFNENNLDDLQILNNLKNKEYYALNILKLESTEYSKAINGWTNSDVKKRNIAKKNNLNYLEIFSIDIYECIVALFIYINVIKNGYWVYTLYPSLDDCVRNPIIPHVLDKLKEIE